MKEIPAISGDFSMQEHSIKQFNVKNVTLKIYHCDAKLYEM